MHCYLCNHTDTLPRKGSVRDRPSLRIHECAACGLVYLSSIGHIQDGHYEDSRMHGQELPSIASWLRDTEQDDQRRFEMLKASLPNKKLLDFGCGAAGFLSKARQLAAEVVGIEPERRVRDHWGNAIRIFPSADDTDGGYDLITAFHVIEHLPDPRATLKMLAARMADDGRLVIEVPSSEDALLTLYDCEAFQKFTYWSQHLYLFNAETLRHLAIQAGLKVIAIEQYQRYPLSNHLHWLSRHQSGGHKKWAFLDSHAVIEAYSAALAAIGKCDTLIAHLEKVPEKIPSRASKHNDGALKN